MTRKKRTIARSEDDKARKRSRILDAAFEILKSSGYHEATMKRIAAEAEVSYGTLYWHFKSKEEIFFAVLERELMAYDDEYEKLLQADMPALDKLRLLLFFSVGTLDRSSDYVKLMYSALVGSGERFERNFEDMVHSMYGKYNALVDGLLKQAQMEGSVRQDLDTRAVAVTLVSMLDALYLQYGFGTATMDTDRLAQGLWDFLTKGVAKT
jgi:TetR/AcrR family fatty acid metabolism transcriptional regulator